MPQHYLGEKGECELCGREIEYVAPYWRHVDGVSVYPARPKPKKEQADARGEETEGEGGTDPDLQAN